ncbi:MAG TPA: hypothetical protein VF211_02950 [Burkholderiales bacterium]
MRLQFVEEFVQAVPEEPGIFTLWDHSLPVYIGRTAPRSNLRAAEELRDYFERWGTLPRYNERTPAHDLSRPVPPEPQPVRR